MKFEIRNRWTAAVIFECEADSLRFAVELAVSKRVSLSGADLSDANLSGANLSGANLSGANLSGAKSDFFSILDAAKSEVPGLYMALLDGKVDGSTYTGECACLVGTIANVKGVKYDKVAGIEPNSYRPAERWFLGIRKGDTPDNNPVSALTVEWVREYAKANDIKLPTRKVTWEVA